jgi:hypothetical protein
VSHKPADVGGGPAAEFALIVYEFQCTTVDSVSLFGGNANTNSWCVDGYIQGFSEQERILERSVLFELVHWHTMHDGG